MRNHIRGGNGVAAALLDFAGDIVKSIGKGLGFMLAVIFCGALIGAFGGGGFALTQGLPLVTSIGIGAVAGAALALLAIIVVAFMQSW